MGVLKNILLVEDDEKDVELHLAALAKFNLANRVDVVRDGQEALDYLYCRNQYHDRANGRPVVVLLDLKMPKVDGLEVLRIMKSDENLRMIPVVMLTSSREKSDILESYKHHANAYVVKPVDFKELIDAIKTLGLFWAVINEPPPLKMNGAGGK